VSRLPLSALLLILTGSSSAVDRMLPGAEGIRVPAGWTASVLCTGIPGADGLALSRDGRLFVASETTGRVLEVAGPDSLVTVMEGLRNPEGIACDASGCLFVVEDASPGRLLVLEPGGEIRVLAEGLSYPEGVSASGDGTLLVTQSTAEDGSMPPFLTSVSVAGDDGLEAVASALWLWSFSGVAVDHAGTVYVCNETAGLPLIGASVIRADPSDGSMEVFCEGLQACEGLCFSDGGVFPLYVAEEDAAGGGGRVSLVDDRGETTVFASGFGSIEDVLADPYGRVFVSEDAGGRIVLIEPVGMP